MTTNDKPRNVRITATEAGWLLNRLGKFKREQEIAAEREGASPKAIQEAAREGAIADSLIDRIMSEGR